jgi:hypothetical protein
MQWADLFGQFGVESPDHDILAIDSVTPLTRAPAMVTILRPVGNQPRPGVARRLLVIACGASVFLLIAACSSSPSRAQQPPRAEAVAKTEKRPAAEKPAEKKKDEADQAKAKRAEEEAARAELTTARKRLYRSLFLAELRFIRVSSGASEEQARRMARAAQGPLQAAVAEFVQNELKKPQAPGFDSTAAFRSVQDAVSAIAKAQLTPEQWARYRDQVAKRTAHRKQAAIRGMLARLEQKLRLTADQRDKLGESLSAHWNPSWDNAVVLIGTNSNFPEIPDPVILPFLTESQKAAWKAIDKGTWNMDVAAEVALMATEGDPPGDDLDADKASGPAPKR